MTTARVLRAVAASAVIAPAFISPPAHAAVPLPQLKIDPSQTTVSGLSSGGFMANQLGYAHSATFKGVGVFAAGPYMCAGHSNYTACMYNASITSSMLNTMQADLNNWSGSSIDALAHVANQKVYLFVGTSDYTVGPNPMNAANTQYANNGVAAANKVYVQRSGTAHVFPTDFDGTGNNSCGSSASPYIANCSYDGAKAVLSHFYGTLAARNNAPAAANYIEFDQTPFIAGNPGMAATGWAYVPANCAAGATCKLHVALHGCQQTYATIGDKFIKNTGYTRWADTNSIVVLFPQTKVDATSRQTAASGSLPNPNGCWDWVGWYGNNFAQKAGTQVAALKAMVDHVSSGSGGGGGGGGLAAPSGVGTSNPTNTTMTIAWSGVSGAAGYRVFRGGTQVNGGLVGGTSYTDTGLAPGTTYSWTVAAVDANGAQGAMSAPASGTTTGYTATCTTASNYAHVSAGRATQSGGYAYAKGSNQNMGLWNVFIVTTLKQTAPGYYVIGTC
jgi:poly(3-hydroxybutyrate) depolymerase